MPTFMEVLKLEPKTCIAALVDGVRVSEQFYGKRLNSEY